MQKITQLALILSNVLALQWLIHYGVDFRYGAFIVVVVMNHIMAICVARLHCNCKLLRGELRDIAVKPVRLPVVEESPESESSKTESLSDYESSSQTSPLTSPMRLDLTKLDSQSSHDTSSSQDSQDSDDMTTMLRSSTKTYLHHAM